MVKYIEYKIVHLNKIFQVSTNKKTEIMEFLSTREKIFAVPLKEVANVTDEEVARAKEKLAGYPIQENEKVIGQMSRFEKAIFAVIIKIESDFKDKNGFGPSSSEADYSELSCCLDFGQDDAETLKLKALADSRSDLSFLGFTLKYLISGRLDVQNFGLRENFQIISLEREEDVPEFKAGNNCVICALKDTCPYLNEGKKGKGFCAKMRIEKTDAESKKRKT